MTFLNYTDEGFPRVPLWEIGRQLCERLIDELRSMGEDAVASQVRHLVVPVQHLGGVPDDFSFLSFPLPRPTMAERKELPMTDSRKIELHNGTVRVKVSIDEFEQIDWLYVAGWPELFDILSIALSTAAAKSQ